MSKSKIEISQKIEQEHQNLRADISLLEDEVNKHVEKEQLTSWKLDIMGRLRDFQNHLSKHFDLEEEGGFMDEISNIAPQHQDKIDQLENEHKQITHDLDAVIEDLKQLHQGDFGQLTGIRERILGIFTNLHTHEALERELMQDVYLQDTGAGD